MESDQQPSFGDSNELLEPRMKNKSMCNILIMSVSFLLIFTAFNSSSLIQKPIVDSIRQIDHVNWHSFISLSIIYGVFSFGNFLVPSILSVVSSARCLFFSSLTYFTYTIIFLHPIPYVLEIVSVILGLGAAVIWTAQGNYLTENSDNKTIDRNTGIFWAIFQGSLVFGNLFLYFQLKGYDSEPKTNGTLFLLKSNETSKPNLIPSETRFKIYLALSITCGLGCLLLLFLKKTTLRTITTDSDQTLNQTDPLTAFKKCLKLFKTRNMLLLSIACFFTGLELSFYSGVYPPVIGNTLSKEDIGIYGVFVGIGSITGGLLFGLIGKSFVKGNRSRVFLLGFIVHVIAYFLIYLNHANNSTREDDAPNYENTLFPTSKSIAFFNGFLLGFGDACFNTQIISLIGTIFTEDSNYTSSAFALYKFTQSIGASISFCYSYFEILLNLQLIILVIFSVFGSLSFILVEYFVKKELE